MKQVRNYLQSLVVKIKKHFNQFTMSFCVIMCYQNFLVSAAALRSTTVGSETTSTGRCEPVGTEQMSTGHLVVFASLRSVQDIHWMSCTLVFSLIRVRKRWWDDITVIKSLKTGEISIGIVRLTKYDK